MNRPTNDHDALMDTLSGSTVHVVIHCQVEPDDSRPLCREQTTVYHDRVDDFSPSGVMQNLKHKGWVYRYNADVNGFNQWVCPVCLAKEGGAA